MKSTSTGTSSRVISDPSSSLSWTNGLMSLLILTAVLTGLRVQLNESNRKPKQSFATGMKFIKFMSDTDIIVSFAAQNANKPEGTGVNNTFDFTITRTPILGGGATQVVMITVQYAVTGDGPNPATADDFPGDTFPSGIFTFPAMDLTYMRTLSIPVNPDSTFEQHEGFRVTISNPMAFGGTGGNAGNNTAYLQGFVATLSANGTILNDDLFAQCIPDHSIYLDADCSTTTPAADFVTTLIDTCNPAGGLTFMVARELAPAGSGVYGAFGPTVNFTGLDLANITSCTDPANVGDTFGIRVIVANTCGGIDTVMCSVQVRDTALPTLINCPIDNGYCCESDYSWTHPTASDNCAVLCREFQVEAYNSGGFVVIDPLTGIPTPGLLTPFVDGSNFTLAINCSDSLYRIRYFIRDVHGNPTTAPLTPICEFILVKDTVISDITLIGPDTSCVGDGTILQVVLNATSGTGPYDFYYNDVIFSQNDDCEPFAVGGTFIDLDIVSGFDTLDYTGFAPGTYTITLDSVVDANGCYNATNKSVTFTILPLPEGRDSVKTIENCSGDSVNLVNLIKCNLPATFSWYAVASVGSIIPYDNPNVLGETVAPANTSSLINEILTNITAAPQTIIYSVTPTSIDGNCVGVPFYISLTINPSIIQFVANDVVNVSLDQNCMKVISASDVLKNFSGCDGLVDVSLVYPFGTTTYSPANKLDRSHIGYCMIVTLTDITTGNKSWSKVCVEDKLPPLLNCGIIDTVTCFEYGNLPKGSYEIADNCGPPVKVTVVGETFTDYGCDSAVLQGVVTRQLVARDQWGNSVNCIKTFHIIKLDLDSVICVRDTMVDCSKEIVELTIDGVKKKVSILDPIRSGYPTVKTAKGIKKLGLNNASCKMTVSYKDERLVLCGNSYKVFRTWLIADWCTGEEKFCYQYISVVDITAPIVSNKVLGDVSSTPHDCGQFINLDTLKVADCNKVKQTYFLKYDEEGTTRVVNGTLPASKVWLPIGSHLIDVQLLDACGNESRGTIRVNVIDNTPPTPVCDEYTQVTVDPATCWAAVAAKDLDNGSRDNCDKPLHFAAALMDSIDYWTKYWTTKLEEKCGKGEFWNNKELYDSWIQDWIDCYVFRDTVYFDECGTNSVVLRVYEADRIPRLDTHVFPWSEHAWYCYNSNVVYRIAHNYNFFDANGSKSKSWRLPLNCKDSLDLWISSQKSKYISTRFGFIGDIIPNPNNQPMVTIQSHTTYCPVDTAINLNPGECSRIVKFTVDLPAGYTAIQTAGLPSGSEFPIGTTINAFNIFNANVLVTNCSFSVKIIEYDLLPEAFKPMETIQSHTTYCPVDTTINLNPGECSRIVKYSILLPMGYTAVQTAGLPSGSEFPIGTTVNAFNIFNGNTLVTTCSFNVTIKQFNMPSAEVYCKENVTVILNDFIHFIGADEVLINGLYGCFDNYIMEITKNGSAYVPAIVIGQDLGKTYIYRVTDPTTGKKCSGQVLITTPFYCKEQATIKLNNSGFVVLGAGDVLIDAQYRCFDNYIVEFKRGNSFIPGVADIQNVGMTLEYRVTDPVTSATCTGKVFVDDVNGSIEHLNILDARRKARTLYSDCMVQVLVDDKQAPVVADLQDITIYCDGAPDYADAPDCGRGDVYPGVDGWPLEIKDSKGVIHGYYGGSDYLGIHVTAGEHEDPQACQPSQGWAPIYCRSWLYVDSFDQAGHVDPKNYFDKLILFDKTRPTKAIKGNEFSITDNCRLDDASLKVTDNGTLNSCGEGWIQRTWTIKDKCGNAVTATQKIIVKHRSDFEVIFPEDKIVTCDFLNRTDTSRNGAGRPTITDDECEQIGVRYTDEIFTVEDSACYKIVRTWTLIDWCIYDANQHNHAPDVIVNDSLRANNKDRSCVYRNIKDNNDGFMQYVQIIKVIDELAPVVTCSDQTVCITSGCSTTVNIPLNGTDNCADEVIFRVDITKPDGTHDLRSNIKAVTGTYTEGIYKIKIIGKDRCGNEDTCDMNLTIKDCKKPTPYCINGVATVVMPSTGAVTVWARDLNLNSEDNCTPKDQLRYSFTADTTTSSRIMNCADLSSNGQLQIIPVDIYVTDNAGNQDLCKTYIQLQDNADVAGGRPQGACKDTVASIAGVISGRLQTEGHEGVESAVVELKGETNPGIPSFKSGLDGSYQFNALPVDGKYTIKALRDDQPMNGVSTLDLVLIQKHILGTESFKSPYKIIAADADNNNDVSVIDLIELRKLILGIYDKLPNNTSWKFVPKSYAFSNALSPWGYATEETVDAKGGPEASGWVKDFVGIKIGDVNATAAAHSLMGTEIRSGVTGLIFEVQDQVFKAGDKVGVEFRSPNFKGVSGFQGTLAMSNALRATSTPRTSLVAAGGSLKMTDNNFGRRWEHEGMITMSWNTNTSMDLKDDAVLFTMHFTAQAAGRLSDVLRIGSQHTIAESYEGKGELGNLSIRFVGKDGKEVAGKSELYQNYPNPFDQRTVIGLNLAEGVKGNLKITDVMGRTVRTINKDWNKGYNEVWINKSELKETGILFYTFESKNYTATRRMVLLE